jgi:hypothetical protein
MSDECFLIITWVVEKMPTSFYILSELLMEIEKVLLFRGEILHTSVLEILIFLLLKKYTWFIL